jgi:hydrogenase maturation protease
MILIAGVGYSNLGDMSFGRVLISDLAKMRWPDHVHVEDLSYGPIMIYHWLESSPIKYDKAIFISAAKRGRAPGTLEVYSWQHPRLEATEIQARIEEAVTGIISLDNLLIICRHFDVLPKDIVVVEIEPQDDDWGLEFSPVVAARVGDAIEIIRQEAVKDS